MFKMYMMNECEYCHLAEDYIVNHLKENVIKLNVKEPTVQTALLSILPDVTTVPQVFYNGKYVGNYDDLVRDF